MTTQGINNQPINSQTDQELILSPRILQLYGEKDIHVLLNLLRLKEPEAYIHVLRVATLMDRVFRVSDDILRGSLLHDVGKMVIPFSLTLYPCALTENEKKIVGIHTLLGAEILTGYNETIINCVLYHHDESFVMDYVQQLRACDIFDALMSNRPYRRACSLVKTVEIMTSMGIHPDLIQNIASKHKNLVQCMYQKEREDMLL